MCAAFLPLACLLHLFTSQDTTDATSYTMTQQWCPDLIQVLFGVVNEPASNDYANAEVRHVHSSCLGIKPSQLGMLTATIHFCNAILIVVIRYSGRLHHLAGRRLRRSMLVPHECSCCCNSRSGKGCWRYLAPCCRPGKLTGHHNIDIIADHLTLLELSCLIMLM